MWLWRWPWHLDYLFRLLLSTDKRENAEPWQRLPFRRLGGNVGEIYSTYEFGRRERRLSMGFAGKTREASLGGFKLGESEGCPAAQAGLGKGTQVQGDGPDGNGVL